MGLKSDLMKWGHTGTVSVGTGERSPKGEKGVRLKGRRESDVDSESDDRVRRCVQRRQYSEITLQFVMKDMETLVKVRKSQIILTQWKLIPRAD